MLLLDNVPWFFSWLEFNSSFVFLDPLPSLPTFSLSLDQHPNLLHFLGEQMLCPQLIAPGMCLAGLMAVRGRRLPWGGGSVLMAPFLVSCFECYPGLAPVLALGPLLHIKGLAWQHFPVGSSACFCVLLGVGVLSRRSLSKLHRPTSPHPTTPGDDLPPVLWGNTLPLGSLSWLLNQVAGSRLAPQTVWGQGEPRQSSNGK